MAEHCECAGRLARLICRREAVQKRHLAGWQETGEAWGTTQIVLKPSWKVTCCLKEYSTYQVSAIDRPGGDHDARRWRTRGEEAPIGCR